jgi:dTDP-4-amino-4,6-dideoxygalactose transaminase
MAEWTRIRTEIAMRLRAVLARFESIVRVPLPRQGMTHAFYRLYAYVRPEALRAGWDRDRIVAESVARGAPIFQGSCSEVYLEEAFTGTNWRPAERLPVARELGGTSLMFLTHPTLSDDEVNRMCTVLEGVLGEASA